MEIVGVVYGVVAVGVCHFYMGTTEPEDWNYSVGRLAVRCLLWPLDLLVLLVKELNHVLRGN